MGKISNNVRAAKNPTEALTVIAHALDEFDSRLLNLERANVNGWDEWSDETPPLTEDWGEPQPWTPDPTDVEEVSRIEEALPGCEDADESKALRAQLELAKDKLKPPIEMIDTEGQHTEIAADESGDATVNVPTVNPGKEAMRKEFATEVLKLTEVYGDKGEQYIESYAKAGPLLLYYADRDFILGLTDDIKRAMVSDVEEQSPKEAHEMARDILKDLDAGGPEITVENIVRSMGD